MNSAADHSANPTSISKETYSSPKYDDKCETRGLAVIAQTFDSSTESKLDNAQKLADVLKTIDCTIFNGKTHETLTRKHFETLCDEVAKVDFREHYCLLFVIFCRGIPGLIRFHDSSKLEHSDILQNFQPHKCKSLAVKPKMFIIQTIKDEGDQPDNGNESDQIKIPRGSDFLTYSSYARFSPKGNIFLRLMIDVLIEEKHNWHSDKHTDDVPEIHTILIKINQKFKKEFPNENVPIAMSSLTKRMYLIKRK